MREEVTGTSHLSSRLKNCLLTILEFEGALSRTQLGNALAQELTLLKDMVQKLEQVQINEEEVRRIEAATEKFLTEIRETLSGASGKSVPARVLQ